MDIDQHVADLRRDITDSVALNESRYANMSMDEMFGCWEEYYNREEDTNSAMHLPLTEEEKNEMRLLDRYIKAEIPKNVTRDKADQALEALDFFSKANQFLSAAGHKVSYYVLDRETEEGGTRGYYQPHDQSIHVPERNINYDGGLQRSSTLAHEVLHAVDHYICKKVCEEETQDRSELMRRALIKDSYTSLAMARFLDDNHNATRGEWEEETSKVFGIDLSSSSFACYKDNFVTELLPRLVQKDMLGVDLISRISAETSPNNKALTHNVFHSLQQKVSELRDGLPLSLQASGEFLDVFSERLGDMRSRIQGMAAPHPKAQIVPVVDGNSIFDFVNGVCDVKKSIESFSKLPEKDQGEKLSQGNIGATQYSGR